MSVLIDSSAWLEYFRDLESAEAVDLLIDEGRLATNDLILAELLPALTMRGQHELGDLLREMQRYPLQINWGELIDWQVLCLRNGISRVAIPDLAIAQNAIQHGIPLFSCDRQFRLLSRFVPLELYP